MAMDGSWRWGRDLREGGAVRSWLVLAAACAVVAVLVVAPEASDVSWEGKWLRMEFLNVPVAEHMRMRSTLARWLMALRTRETSRESMSQSSKPELPTGKATGPPLF